MKSIFRVAAFAAFTAVAYACSDATPAGPTAGNDTHAAVSTTSGTSSSDTSTKAPGDTATHSPPSDTAVHTPPADSNPTSMPPDTAGSPPSDSGTAHATLITVAGTVLGWAAGDTTHVNGPVASASVVVKAHDIEGQLTVVGSATSDAAGHFSISNVPWGEIVVVVTPPPGSPYLPSTFTLAAVYGDVNLSAFLRHQ